MVQFAKRNYQHFFKQKFKYFSNFQPVLTKEEEERIFAEYHYTGATTNIHPLLSSLVNYTHPVKFSGFDVAEGMFTKIVAAEISQATQAKEGA